MFLSGTSTATRMIVSRTCFMRISITRAVTLNPTSLPVQSLEGSGSFGRKVAIFWLALPTLWRCGFHWVSKTVVPAAHFDHELRIAMVPARYLEGQH